MIDTKPIVAPATSIPDQLAAAVRQILLAVGGWAVGRGYLEADTVTAIATVAVIAVPFIYGQIRTAQRVHQVTTLAQHVPDSVARIKGEPQ